MLPKVGDFRYVASKLMLPKEEKGTLHGEAINGTLFKHFVEAL